jgi:formate dehydrogenase major subunit
MPKKLTFHRRSEDEDIKQSGLFLDFDEMAAKGAMGGAEANIAKWYGIYKSRQPGNHMARIVIPAGVITSAQAKNIASVSEKYGQGVVSITTRQTLQLHWLKVGNLPDMLREIRTTGNSTKHGCGDVTRNVTACPLAETCRYRRLDARKWAIATSGLLQSCRDLDDLPRKFKVNYSGCPADCAQPQINCVGLSGVLHGGKTGFKVVIGGGMGWKPFIAQSLFSFVPEDKATAVCRAVALLFKDHGDRFNRAKSRLKFVVHRKGIDFCRAVVLENLVKEGIGTNNILTDPIIDEGCTFPPRPLLEENPKGTDNMHAVRAFIPKGELSFAKFFELAQLAERYADQRLYTTNRQNLELHGVSEEDIAPLAKKINELGFKTYGSFSLTDIVACVGTTYCPKAVTKTRTLFDQIDEVVTNPKYRGISAGGIINITGCPNSCSPYRIADMGFRGMRIREEEGSVEGYEILLGGSLTSYGKKLGEYKLDDCKEVAALVLDEFVKVRKGEETLNECVDRLSIDHFKKLMAFKYNTAPSPLETSVEKGSGYAPLDLKTNAKSIPCQEACPSKTNVPLYIEHIARGEHDEAYRVNQEDNVFPGVLGRICTRVCEDECRHMWTNVEGPVQICHLKRYAADHIRQNQGALAAHFGSSDKQVAVIGAGPAGLSAARELARLGHKVMVYERGPVAGGMLVDGIPAFRLPRDIVTAEVDLIKQGGVDIVLNHEIDRGALEKLYADNDAVLVTVGTTKTSTVPIKGVGDSAISGLDFMRQFNRGELSHVAGNVVVIGGGFTAVDCARTARRIGDKGANITIAYRRTEAFMAADENEFKAMDQEYVTVATLLSPKALETRADGSRVLVLERNIVKGGMDGNKPAIEAVKGSRVEMPCDTVILAIGQSRDDSLLPQGVSFAEGYTTSDAQIFVAGDFQGGSADVISAVAAGKDAALEMDTFLMGEKRLIPAVHIDVTDCDGETGRYRDHDIQWPLPMPMSSIEKRSEPDAEVEIGFSEDIAQVAATRCYLCHYKFEIDQDLCIHCDWCIQAAPRKCIKKVSKVYFDDDGFPVRYMESELSKDTTFIYIDNDECIRCGKCLRVCPTQAISMKKLALDRCCKSAKAEKTATA